MPTAPVVSASPLHPRRMAVVLANLGGPDSPQAVEPFLYNLFNDPAIIGAPGLIRRWLARRISRKRAPLAQEIYAHMGGKSPLLEETRAQAAALQSALHRTHPDYRWQVWPLMRYWHPRSDAVAAEVAAYDPEAVLFVPLYPQYSTTTTGSSLRDWQQAAAAVGLRAPTRALCCDPLADGLIAAHAEAVASVWRTAQARHPGQRFRLLYSAHGLPEKVIRKGDPYQWQVEQTAAAVTAALRTMGVLSAEDAPVVCYQSRVGPLRWIGPSTDDTIRRAGADGVGIVLTPIAFVSEHSETLVELDMEYRHLAEEHGVAAYFRVPALGVRRGYVESLTHACSQLLHATAPVSPPCRHPGTPAARLCPADRTACPHAVQGAG